MLHFFLQRTKRGLPADNRAIRSWNKLYDTYRKRMYSINTELKSGSSGDVSSTNTTSLVAAGTNTTSLVAASTQTDVQTEIGDLAASEQSVVAGHGGSTPKRPRFALPANKRPLQEASNETQKQPWSNFYIVRM